jgi:hypothetical protein
MKAGDLIDIYCSRCKLNMDGAIAAVVGEKVAQVTCRTCNTTQAYRPHLDEAIKRKRMLKQAFAIKERRDAQSQATEKKNRVSGNDNTDRWRVATENVDSRFASMYKAEKTYRLEDVIIHSQHGLGVVSQILHDNAFLCLFRELEAPLEMSKPRDDS